MKQIYIQIKTPGNIKDVDRANNSSILDRKSINETKLMSLQSGGIEERLLRQGRGLNIFLTQNKGKGPPGRQRSPGTQSHPELVSGSNAQGSRPRTEFGVTNSTFNNTIHTEQIVNSTQKLNFYLQLNFTNMKKQILILVLFVLAAFAGINKSYGQCVEGPLSPAAGRTYNYGVTVTGSGTAAAHLWYVTQDLNILNPTTILTPGASAGLGDFTVAAGGSTYSTTTGGQNNINIIWNPIAVSNANPYYLVVKYTETSPAPGSCTVENMKVYRIKPINTFLLAVNASDLTGATATATCAAPVSFATITPGTNTATVEYRYGQNTLYFKVTASGILGAWKPTVNLPALGGLGQNYVSVDWTANGGTSWTGMTGAAGSNLAGGTFTSTADATVTDATAGTPIVVRVVIDNRNFETLVDQTINLGVDGWLPTGYTISDIKSISDCTDEIPFGKNANFIIQKRPTVAATVPAVPLINKLP